MKKYNVGMEAVDFQDTSFFKALTYQYSELMKLDKDEIVNEVHALPIAKEIKKYTNLTVVVVLSKDFSHGPAVATPDVFKSHVLYQDYHKAYLHNTDGVKLIKSTKDTVVGGVNLRTGKVTGSFANVQHIIYIPVATIKDNKLNLSAEELAAITLHEVGHLLTYYEYINRTVTTNQVLTGVAQSLASTNDVDETEVVLLTAKQYLKLDDLDIKKLTKGTNKKTVELVILSHVVAKTESDLGSNIYDSNTWEALADNYATRMGAGQYLVSSLDKMYRSASHSSYRSTSVFLFLEAVKLTTLISSVVLSVLPNPLLNVFGKVGLIAFFFLFAHDVDTVVYDRPSVRIKRIRDQCVRRLNDKGIKKEEKKRLSDDIDLIDGYLAKVEDKRQFFSVLGGLIFTKGAKRYKDEKMQQELESLVSNELFTLTA